VLLVGTRGCYILRIYFVFFVLLFVIVVVIVFIVLVIVSCFVSSQSRNPRGVPVCCLSARGIVVMVLDFFWFILLFNCFGFCKFYINWSLICCLLTE